MTISMNTPPPPQVLIVSAIVSAIISNKLTVNQQNYVGNLLELIGQNILTVNAQLTLPQYANIVASQNNTSNSNTSNSGNNLSGNSNTSSSGNNNINSINIEVLLEEIEKLKDMNRELEQEIKRVNSKIKELQKNIKKEK